MPQIQKPTKNAISQAQHGAYKAVDYTSWAVKYITRRPQVYATEDGIIATGTDARLGRYIRLTSTDGKRRHTFGHLELYYVKSTQRVKRGQLIGKMGYTGYTIPAGVSGTHLHRVYLDLTTNTYHYPPTKDNVAFRIFTPESKSVTVTTAILNCRADATTASRIVRTYTKGQVVKVVGWVTGQSVDGNGKWYMTSANQYIWSGGVR